MTEQWDEAGPEDLGPFDDEDPGREQFLMYKKEDEFDENPGGRMFGEDPQDLDYDPIEERRLFGDDPYEREIFK